MKNQDDDWFHDKYIEIVSDNWSLEHWSRLATEAREHFSWIIFKADGRDGLTFTWIWIENWSLVEEVRLTGEATSVISHPHDRKEEVIMEEPEQTTRTWNAFENRCDVCGAESWIQFERIITLNEVETHHQDFFFCGHHGRKHSEALVAVGFEATDYTHEINSEPSISANAV